MKTWSESHAFREQQGVSRAFHAYLSHACFVIAGADYFIGVET